MSLHDYQLIKLCYPVILIPCNPFILDVIFNDCGCPHGHIAIYLLQNRKGTEKTKFFFSFSQALKEFKSRTKDENKKLIQDELDLLTFQVDIDNSFDYSVNIIDDVSLFKAEIINPTSPEALAHIENELTPYKLTLENVASDIKQESFNIYDKVRDGNIELKKVLDKINLNFSNSTKIRSSI